MQRFFQRWSTSPLCIGVFTFFALSLFPKAYALGDAATGRIEARVPKVLLRYRVRGYSLWQSQSDGSPIRVKRRIPSSGIVLDRTDVRQSGHYLGINARPFVRRRSVSRVNENPVPLENGKFIPIPARCGKYDINTQFSRGTKTFTLATNEVVVDASQCGDNSEVPPPNNDSYTPPAGPNPEDPPSLSPSGAQLTGVWVNSGEEKVAQEDTPKSRGKSVTNSIWNGSRIQLFGGKNEVISFNVILEAAKRAVTIDSVTVDALRGPSDSIIPTKQVSGDGVFNFVGRNIEVFASRYLQIRGLSRLSYEVYDERHIPEKFQRPYSGEGNGQGSWDDRPDADKHYPDIAVPIEVALPLNIPAGNSQGIWTDIYIPKNAVSGTYLGLIRIREQGGAEFRIPIEILVMRFTLPDEPSSKTMIYLGDSDVNARYFGDANATGGQVQAVRDRHFLLAHRHKLSLIDGSSEGHDAPTPQWIPRLTGELFTAQHGYDGPGVGIGNNVYSVGTYSSWSWKGEGRSAMWQHTDAWSRWFQSNSPQTEYFLYLVDESDNYSEINQWASWIHSNPGPGASMKSFATLSLPMARQNAPELDIAASWMASGIKKDWETGSQYFVNNSGKRAYMYNGKRPASGTFAIEDDGIALRELSWGQYKKGIARWFFWESTYYNNFQGGTGDTNVFRQAQTFGGTGDWDSSTGEGGWNYSNGDGVLFYPGTDRMYQRDSYNLSGPIASLRMKYWRRGVQDVDYIELARKVDPNAVNRIVNEMVPKVLWEYGVSDPSDPTWVRTDISWTNNPDDWEAARRALAEIIDR